MLNYAKRLKGIKLLYSPSCHTHHIYKIYSGGWEIIPQASYSFKT